MAKKNSVMKRVDPSFAETLGLVKKEAKETLGLDISDVDASKLIAQSYQENKFLKTKNDKFSKIL